MNIDGTGRVKVADNARQPCWSPDGKTIAYLKGEYERYTTRAIGTKGLFFYDLATGRACREIDRLYLPTLLQKHHNNQSRAAKEAGIDRKTFASRLIDALQADEDSPHA